MDLPQGTVVQVSSAETKTGPLPETELWFWLNVMAAFDNAEDLDSEYYNTTLLGLEHAPPTLFITHLNPTAVTTTPPSPYPKSMPARDIPLGQLC